MPEKYRLSSTVLCVGTMGVHEPRDKHPCSTTVHARFEHWPRTRDHPATCLGLSLGAVAQSFFGLQRHETAVVLRTLTKRDDLACGKIKSDHTTDILKEKKQLFRWSALY